MVNGKKRHIYNQDRLVGSYGDECLFSPLFLMLE